MILQLDSDQSKNWDLVEVTIVLSEGTNTLQGGTNRRKQCCWYTDRQNFSLQCSLVLKFYTCMSYICSDGTNHKHGTDDIITARYTPQALSKMVKKKEAKLRTFASVSYRSTQLPKVLPVLSADDTHDCIQSLCPLQEDSNLELPGIEGGEGRSCCSEVGSKVYMQVIIHAQVWMVQ